MVSAMKLLSYLGPDAALRCGALIGTRVVDLTDACADLDVPQAVLDELRRRGSTPAQGGLMRVLQSGPQGQARLAETVREAIERGDLDRCANVDGLPLLAPVPRPGKIVAVGRNYGAHARETGVEPSAEPRLLAKLPSSVVGHGARIRPPAAVRKLDFEIELAVVIGAFACEVARDRALQVVAGYTILDDLSAREFQFDTSPPQTTFAKSMDGFCPMGPWLVTKDEIEDPQCLALRCDVNGVTMQQASTADMLFPVDRLVEYITRHMTLEPGDVIATGTPAGSGAFRDPPTWLAPGDRIRMEISGLGVLEHEIA
jgi:2-keto-4-pentenoate hydratase/2-oxohepta-3-ene-1,7-dioic acid hydratase in catechol pathway